MTSIWRCLNLTFKTVTAPRFVFRLMKQHRRHLLALDHDPLTPWEIQHFSDSFGEAFVKELCAATTGLLIPRWCSVAEKGPQQRTGQTGLDCQHDKADQQ